MHQDSRSSKRRTAFCLEDKKLKRYKRQNMSFRDKVHDYQASSGYTKNDV